MEKKKKKEKKYNQIASLAILFPFCHLLMISYVFLEIKKKKM